MIYTYGMRLRGFAPGCQPLEGLIRIEDDPSGKYYYNLLTYNRKLTEAEVKQYELDPLAFKKSERKPGRWIHGSTKAEFFNNRCSECGRSIGYWNPKPVYRYCPFCGAEMSEGDNA